MGARRVPVRRAESAGGVIFRLRGNEIEVAVIVLRGGRVFGLPKGSVAEGETPEETAVREVAEETGLTGRVVDHLMTIDYWFYSECDEARVHKFVHYYLLEYEAGSTDNHDDEVDDARWMPAREALALLSFANERRVLEEAVSRIMGRVDVSLGGSA